MVAGRIRLVVDGLEPGDRAVVADRLGQACKAGRVADVERAPTLRKPKGRPQPVWVGVVEEIISPVLDSGCGTGEHALLLAERGMDVVGIDNDMRGRFFGPAASTQAVIDDLTATLAEYRHALDADSQSADARFGYGLAFARLGRYAEAREVLSEGARLYPEQSRFAEMVARVDAARRPRP